MKYKTKSITPLTRIPSVFSTEETVRALLLLVLRKCCKRLPIFILYFGMLQNSPYKQALPLSRNFGGYSHVSLCLGKGWKEGQFLNWGQEMGWQVLSPAVSGSAGHFSMTGIARHSCYCIHSLSVYLASV